MSTRAISNVARLPSKHPLSRPTFHSRASTTAAEPGEPPSLQHTASRSRPPTAAAKAALRAEHHMLHRFLRAGHTGRATSIVCNLIDSHNPVRRRTAVSLIRGLIKSSPDASPDDPNVQYALQIAKTIAEPSMASSQPAFAEVIHAFCDARMPLPAAELLEHIRSRSSKRIGSSRSQKSRAFGEPSYYPILRCISRGLHGHSQSGCSSKFIQAVQALLKLARLLDQGLICPPNISSLLRQMYSIPRCNCTTVSNQRSRQEEKYAEPYFQIHDILQRFITRQAFQNSSHLDLHTRNSMLHYALRYRRSWPLATRILNAMFADPTGPPPQPSTYNIVIRSATLSRDNQLAKAVLQKLTLDQDDASQSLLSICGLPEDLAVDSFLRERGIGLPTETVQANVLSLMALVSFLVSSGQPERTLPMIETIFPSLRKLPQGQPSFEDACRGASMGPELYSVLLNALVRCGKTQLGLRFWEFAAYTEAISWRLATRSECAPWVLPIHAYTSALLLHTHNASRALSTETTKQDHQDTAQTHAEAAKSYHSWNTSIVEGFRIYSVLMQGHLRTTAVTPEGTLDLEPPGNLRHPKPDARFFNAALDLFGRSPGTGYRPLTPTSTFWRMRTFLATKSFVMQGQLVQPSTSELLTVLRDMSRMGFPIPWRYREYLVGRGDVFHTHRPPDGGQPLGVSARTLPKGSTHIPAVRNRGVGQPDVRIK